ncbi:MAG: ATP-binding protein [Fulvivirga sp.]
MELNEAKRLIRQGESQQIEFKRKIKYPEKVIKELVAFANSDGGWLFIGVSDNGDIAGVKYPEDEIFALNQAIDKYCRPALPKDIQTIKLTESLSIVVYHIPSSDRKPHHIHYDGKKQVFVRSEDKSIKASKQLTEIIERRRKKKSITFNFGDKEKWLMDYLDRNKSITLAEFKTKNKLSTHMASRGLILMVLANVLDIKPSDKEDVYVLKN